MPEAFAVRILTPSARVLDTQAVYLRLPAWDGLMGVMARHAGMVAQVVIGAMQVTQPDGTVRHFATTGGALHVEGGEAIVLAEAAEEAAEIDVDRARLALERAQQRLRAARPGEVDIVRAELALARAANRLHVAGGSHR